MVGMRKDPKVCGGVGGTCEVTKNQTQHSTRKRKRASQNVLNDLLAQTVAALQQEEPQSVPWGFAPDAAIEWIQGVERIFRAMDCTEAQKLVYATYMLVTEAENWCEFTRR
ncbi:hypothetical protein Lal_00042970 [Lupinus albus]|nr:hypothetical protein Lal_00042970 [Lupinus albus]